MLKKLKMKNKMENAKDLVMKNVIKPMSFMDPKSKHKPKPAEDIELTSNSDTETSETMELPYSIPIELTSSIPVELPSSIPVELPSSISNELPSSIPNELTSSISNELPSSIPNELPSSISKELPISISNELPSSIPINYGISHTMKKTKKRLGLRKGLLKRTTTSQKKIERKINIDAQKDRRLVNAQNDMYILLKLMDSLDLNTQQLLMMNHEQLPIMLSKMWPNENAPWVLDLPKIYRWFGETNMRPALEMIKFQDIERVVYSLDCTKELYTFLSESGKNIHTFEILPSRNNDDTKVWPFSPLPQLLPNITNLSVHIDVHAGYIQKFTKLREITIAKNIKQKDLNEIFKYCNNLTELKLLTDDSDLVLETAYAPQLEKLGVSIEVFIKNFDKIMKLRYLNTIGISHKKTSSEKDWIECVNKIIEMRGVYIYQIALTGNNIENNDWIRQFSLDECPQLSELELNDLKHLDDESVVKLVERIPKLEFFTLKNSPLLTKTLLQSIADKRASAGILSNNIDKFLDIESEGCPRFEAASLDPVDGILLKRHCFNFFTDFDAYTSEYNVTKFLLRKAKK